MPRGTTEGEEDGERENGPGVLFLLGSKAGGLGFVGLPFFFFLRFYLFIFRARGREEEKGKETSMMCKRNMDRLPLAHPQLGTWPTTQAWALTGNQTSNLLVHRLTLNPLSHTSQGSLFTSEFKT